MMTTTTAIATTATTTTTTTTLLLAAERKGGGGRGGCHGGVGGGVAYIYFVLIVPNYFGFFSTSPSTVPFSLWNDWRISIFFIIRFQNHRQAQKVGRCGRSSRREDSLNIIKEKRCCLCLGDFVYCHPYLII